MTISTSKAIALLILCICMLALLWPFLDVVSASTDRTNTIVEYELLPPITVYARNEFPTWIANVSAYCPCEECSEGWGRQTASGATAVAGRTIAMPPDIPFGTRVLIDSFPSIVFTVEDRGGLIQGNCIDVFCNTHEETIELGRHDLRIWIVKWGDR